MYLVSQYNYLFLHSLAELFSIFVAVAVFMLAWNTQRFMKDDFPFFIGTPYLFAEMLKFSKLPVNWDTLMFHLVVAVGHHPCLSREFEAHSGKLMTSVWGGKTGPN